MRVVLLGPVQAFADDAAPIEIGGVRLRMLLARLSAEAGRPVSAESLIDDLWGEEAPAGASSALQGLVSRLRKALGAAGGVELVAGGYRLPVRAEDVDVNRFEELVTQGRRELAGGRAKEAATLLGAALGLWQGAALADVLDAPFARNLATRLDGIRAAAVEDRLDAEVRLGRHAEVLADLTTAAAADPLRERLAELRMRALSAAGRQSEALAVYEEIRARLADELGIDPSPELQETHLALLRGELDRPAVQPDRQAAPSRLPAALTSFVGRERELGRLAALMPTSRLVTIVGPGGAGKTRLSLEAAARDRAHGQGRIWFVPLAGVGAGDQLPDAVLGALNGLYDGGGMQQVAAVDRMAGLLDVGDALLVLDNCEHVVEAAADLAARLLDRLPQLRILATSREPLAITGEALCHLGPLELPPADPEPAEAADSAAVRRRPSRLHARRRYGPGRGGDLPPAGRDAAGPGAGRGAHAVDERRPGRPPPRRPLPAAHCGQQERAAPPADAAGGGRVELGPAGRAGADAGSPAVGLPWRRHPDRAGARLRGRFPARRRRGVRDRLAGGEVAGPAGR
ncbi:BTAD domain-containing putative transcriptional regulator [Nonomuraea sp. NPDC059194]|uniref:AfsR/SARP family transcriptional regulator n=1 Tax=Nonomuraea sp. NPDC059194 TaxID=3346764 RepID=UPI0036B752E8